MAGLHLGRDAPAESCPRNSSCPCSWRDMEIQTGPLLPGLSLVHRQSHSLLTAVPLCRILCQSSQKLASEPLRAAQLGILPQIPATGAALLGGDSLCWPAQGAAHRAALRALRGSRGQDSPPAAGREGEKSPADYPAQKGKDFQLCKSQYCPELRIGNHIPELCFSS